MRVVVDASVWLSASDPKEDGHEESVAFLSEAAAQAFRFSEPGLVLAEVAAATARKSRDAQKGRDAMAALQRTPGIEFIELTILRAEQAGECASRHFLRGADSVYAALASELGAELVTLDGELQERSAGEVRALSPKEWIGAHLPSQP